MSDLTKRMQDLLSRSRYVPQPSESLYIEDTPISDDNHVNLSTCQPSSTAQAQNTDCQPPSTLSTFVDLPFPLGNGGLAPVQVEMADRHNTRLGVSDPVQRRLNVLFWLYQHYQESGDLDMAAEVKAAYYSLRDGNPDVVRLARMGEMDESTLLKRLVNGQAMVEPRA